MRHGITFRGKHSNDIGVIVKTVGRPFSPPVKQIDEEVSIETEILTYRKQGADYIMKIKFLNLNFR